MSLESSAREFATACHARIDHRRKYTNEPYINHPAAVVEMVRGVQHTEEMLAAAWLHDTVEDTEASLVDIYNAFGECVAEMVEQLTDVSRPEDGNRAVRKLIDLKHTAKAWPESKTIKLADLIDNTRSIVDRDPAFAVVYLREKAALLEVLKDGDAMLWRMAKALLDDGMAKR